LKLSSTPFFSSLQRLNPSTDNPHVKPKKLQYAFYVDLGHKMAKRAAMPGRHTIMQRHNANVSL
jgi:hypothetical protein